MADSSNEQVDWSAKISNSWVMLVPPTHEGVTSVEVASARDGRPVRLGLDRDGYRHLTIATRSGDAPRTRETDGEVTIRKRVLNFDRVASEVVDVVCVRPDRFADFDELCGLLLPELVDGERPATQLVESMDKWRQLLRERAKQGLSPEERLGLFGELAVLERLVALGLEDVTCWHGPLNSIHDFVLPGGYVEVKSKAGRPTVRIHGASQTASDPAGSPGFLAVVDIEESATVGVKISELVDQLAAYFDPDGFTDRLSAARWRPTEEPDLRYRVERIAYHDVRRLPSIEIQGEADRISSVSYDLDVRGLPETGESELRPLITPPKS